MDRPRNETTTPIYGSPRRIDDGFDGRAGRAGGPALAMHPSGELSVLAAFGATSALALCGASPSAAASDVILFSLGLGGFVASLVWLFVLALSQGVFWALGMLFPPLNLIVASWFARRFWSEGARAPGLLGLLGGILYEVGYIRLLLGDAPTLV